MEKVQYQICATWVVVSKSPFGLLPLVGRHVLKLKVF